jgi:hypothetical protein
MKEGKFVSIPSPRTIVRAIVSSYSAANRDLDHHDRAGAGPRTASRSAGSISPTLVHRTDAPRALRARHRCEVDGGSSMRCPIQRFSTGRPR